MSNVKGIKLGSDGPILNIVSVNDSDHADFESRLNALRQELDELKEDLDRYNNSEEPVNTDSSDN